ncbi:DUF4363 family protein [Clostridium sp. CCUG 7971]|uniref:DUF4363 family protein n=1 Tax=Clostridium sp. CCUG 7971 TaxID=2811414 RepID=UPI001ABB17F4|nr:DUF4363 family protein [Clostridium sp. CCUG 7971]MBO3443983.1 DUF4363 family protein [Clostridium sp. CCUG 7971]
MRSFVYVLIWTILFITFGFYVTNGIGDFTDDYKNKVTIIENYIEEDNLNDAKIALKEVSSSWNKEKSPWYKLLNHESFDLISLHFNILDKSINTNDKSKALENIEIIKVTLGNILESEKCDLNHIL